MSPTFICLFLAHGIVYVTSSSDTTLIRQELDVMKKTVSELTRSCAGVGRGKIPMQPTTEERLKIVESRIQHITRELNLQKRLTTQQAGKINRLYIMMRMTEQGSFLKTTDATLKMKSIRSVPTITQSDLIPLNMSIERNYQLIKNLSTTLTDDFKLKVSKNSQEIGGLVKVSADFIGVHTRFEKELQSVENKLQTQSDTLKNISLSVSQKIAATDTNIANMTSSLQDALHSIHIHFKNLSSLQTQADSVTLKMSKLAEEVLSLKTNLANVNSSVQGTLRYVENNSNHLILLQNELESTCLNISKNKQDTVTANSKISHAILSLQQDFNSFKNYSKVLTAIQNKMNNNNISISKNTQEIHGLIKVSTDFIYLHMNFSKELEKMKSYIALQKEKLSNVSQRADRNRNDIEKDESKHQMLQKEISFIVQITTNLSLEQKQLYPKIQNLIRENQENLHLITELNTTFEVNRKEILHEISKTKGDFELTLNQIGVNQSKILNILEAELLINTKNITRIYDFVQNMSLAQNISEENIRKVQKQINAFNDKQRTSLDNLNKSFQSQAKEINKFHNLTLNALGYQNVSIVKIKSDQDKLNSSLEWQSYLVERVNDSCKINSRDISQIKRDITKYSEARLINDRYIQNIQSKFALLENELHQLQRNTSVQVAKIIQVPNISIANVDMMKVNSNLSDLMYQVHQQDVRYTATLSRISQNEQSIRDINRLLKELGVTTGTQHITQNLQIAFSATFNTKTVTEMHNNQQVIFEDVLINSGSGYNQSNGIFTCPVSGVYVFFTTTFDDSGRQPSIRLSVNGNHIIAWTIGNNGSNMGIAHLQSGDRVGVFSDETISGLALKTRRNSFSGFLLHPDN